jgi:hypothetical protein
MGRHKVTARNQVESRVKLLRAIESRKAGKSYAEIGFEVGWTPAYAQRQISEWMRTVASEPAEDLRELNIARCESIIKTLWTLAMGKPAKAGDPDSEEPPNMAAMDRIGQFMDREARLKGIQTPTRLPADPRAKLAQLMGKTQYGITTVTETRVLETKVETQFPVPQANDQSYIDVEATLIGENSG